MWYVVWRNIIWRMPVAQQCLSKEKQRCRYSGVSVEQRRVRTVFV